MNPALGNQSARASIGLPFGGTKSDRGHGIAASENELFLVGATESQADQSFPLKEWSLVSVLDYYQFWNELGPAGDYNMWVSFSVALNYENTGLGEAPIEDPPLHHDAFIASFDLNVLGTGMMRKTAPPCTRSFH